MIRRVLRWSHPVRDRARHFETSVTRKLLLAAILTTTIALATRPQLTSYLDPNRVRDLLDASGPFAPLTLMGLMALAVVVSPLPSLPLDVAAGIYFGPLLGTLYAATGALFGAVASFLIARILGRDLVERVVGGHISFCTACSDALLTKLVFLTRLIPAVSFDVVSYGAGLTKMSLRRFALATFLGMLPLTFAYVSAGRLLVNHAVASAAAGVVLIAGMLVLPTVIERFNPFGLRDTLQHGGQAGAVAPREPTSTP